MEIRSPHLSSQPLRGYSDRIRSHQQTANKAMDLPEHKTKRASELVLEWDEADGVFSLGGRRLTFACDLVEFDHEGITEHGQSNDHPESAQPAEIEE